MTIGFRSKALARLSLTLPTEDQLRAKFKALVQTYLPELSDLNDSADIVVFGDILAAFFTRYAADLLTDIVNEPFNATGTDYAFVSTRALELGYVPSPGRGSTAVVTLTNRATLAVSVLRSTYVYRTKRAGETEPVTFEMVPASVIVPASGSVSFQVAQGTTVWNESLGTGNGTALQQFYTAQARAVPDSERIYVGTELWSQAPGNNLLLCGATDKCYERWYDEGGHLYVMMGDGVNGSKPEDGAAVICSYRTIKDGQNGNVAAATIIELSPQNPLLSVTNAEAASGWAAADDVETIRFKAARSARVPWEVCINEEDTEVNVERKFPALGRCYVVPGERGENSVGVHILNSSGGSPTAAQKTDVLAFLNLHKPATELDLVFGPSWTDVSIIATVYHDQDYVAGSAATAIDTQLGPLAYDSGGNRAVYPGQVISLKKIESVFMSVLGVTDVSLLSPLDAIAVGTNCLPRFTVTVTEVAA